MCKTLGKQPIVYFKNHQTLKKKLVRSKFNMSEESGKLRDKQRYKCAPCKRARCKCCALINGTKTFRSNETKLEYRLSQNPTARRAIVFTSHPAATMERWTSNSLSIHVNNRRADIKRNDATEGAVRHALIHKDENRCQQEYYHYTIIEQDFNSDKNRKGAEMKWIAQIMADDPYELTAAPPLKWQDLT
ncbi:hypothetical protein GJ496_000055 [Pomphorhynchus laevis]|nr:hypothetical protein GJ496_000055 [Pomphorhynchus laevis]